MKMGVFQTRVMDPPRVKAELTNLFRFFAGTLTNNSRALLGGGAIRAWLESPTDIALLGGNVPRSEIAKSAASVAIIPYLEPKHPSIADAVSAPTASLKLIMRGNEPSDLGSRLVAIWPLQLLGSLRGALLCAIADLSEPLLP
jgi:hypothetical protein